MAPPDKALQTDPVNLSRRPVAYSENRILSIESPLISRPRFAAGDISGEVRVFVQDTR